ncbi:hypothetical protein NQ317_015398, partial [Molorchus minor]
MPQIIGSWSIDHKGSRHATGIGILRRNKVIEDAWLTWSFQRASVCIVGDFQLKIPFLLVQ